jgi:hypothetical protein
MSQKPRRRRVDQAAVTPPRVRITMRLSPEALRRLGVTCAMERVRPGDLLEALIVERSRRWVVQDRGGLSGETSAIE